MHLDLTGKVALVTGASRGIGRAIAEALGEAGAAVTVNYRQQRGQAEAAVAHIESFGGRGLAVQADVGNAAEVEALIESTVRHFGRLDILVNNAGITHDGLTIRLSDEEWDEVLNINLRGAFFCTRSALRGMVRQRWGRIINMSSVVGRTGNAGQANYAAAKAGLIGLTRSVAREVATRNITVNAIAPGFIQTEMTGKLSKAQQQWLLDRIPANRLGTVEEVASLVIYLASDAAAYITGQVLQMDGGLAMA